MLRVLECTFDEERRSASSFNRAWRMTMNEPAVLKKLAIELDDARLPAAMRARDYAPPALRDDPLAKPVEQVKMFGELPTKEIDSMIAECEEQIAELKRKGQALRDLYTKHTDEIVNGVKTLQEVVKLGKEAMQTLHEQCTKVSNHE